MKTALALAAVFVMIQPAFAQDSSKLTLEDCREDDRDGYCFWDLAEQEKDFSYCDLYDIAASFRACFDGVAKLRKPVEADCAAYTMHKSECLKKVKELQ